MCHCVIAAFKIIRPRWSSHPATKQASKRVMQVPAVHGPRFAASGGDSLKPETFGAGRAVQLQTIDSAGLCRSQHRKEGLK